MEVGIAIRRGQRLEPGQSWIPPHQRGRQRGGTFTWTNVPAGTVQLPFQGRGADAMLTISGVAADDRLQISVTLNGRDARLDSRDRMSGGNGVDVNGRIDSIDDAARTLRVVAPR